MFKWLGTLICLVSTLFYIGTIMLSVRSLKHVDLLLVQTPGHKAAGAAAQRGGLLVAYSDVPYEGYESTTGRNWPLAFVSLSPQEYIPLHDTLLDPALIKFSFLAIQTATGTTSITSTTTAKFAVIVVPYWILAFALAILPFIFFRSRMLRRRRRRMGLCIGCGYDIRASAGRCPECGMEIPSSETVSHLAAPNP